MTSWVAWFAIAAVVWVVYRLIRFSKSEVDLSLAAKGKAPAGAFRGKTIWITGASQGLGKALALHFGHHGSRIILSARNETALKAVQAECLSNGAEAAFVVPVDLCSLASVKTAVEAAGAAINGAGIDFLIHNAGASQRALAEEIEPEVVERMFSLNSVAPINLTRLALPLLLKNGSGRVVAVSSMAGVIPSPGQAVYAACKAALNAYCSTLLTEMHDRGLGVTVCCLGPITTGTPGQPRYVYGASSLEPTTDSTKGRLTSESAAAWVAAAAYHGVDRAWITKQPVLLLGYLMQLMPAVAMMLLKHIGPRRARALKEGRDGYAVSELTKRRAP